MLTIYSVCMLNPGQPPSEALNRDSGHLSSLPPSSLNDDCYDLEVHFPFSSIIT